MPPKKNAAPPTLERNIHFYRADVGADDGGRPLSFDPVPALKVISGLPFADNAKGRYLVDDEGNAVCAFPGPNTQSLRFCQIRRSGLPQLEQAGNVSDLNIADNAGLLEAVHVMFFSDNIVGVDFNFYGPRLSRLGYYLHTKSGKAVGLATFHPLLRNDVAEQLKHLTELRLFDLKVRSSYANIIRQADTSLGAAFEANAQVLDGGVDEIELVLKPSKDNRRKALQRLLATLKSLVRGPELRENASRFLVKGKHDQTGRVVEIDLLHDQLIACKQVLRLGERSRAVDSDSAFKAIQIAHDELAGDLRQAAGLSS